MLRRGLAVQRADAAIITNIAEDHFGEFGITSLSALAEAKLIVRRALDRDSVLVLNADDPELVARTPEPGVPVTWFSLDPANPTLRAHIENGGTAVTVEENRVVLYHRDLRNLRTPIAAVRDIPITLLGAARHNIANALGVTALATALGIEPATIERGLTRFDGGTSSNPGRLNLFALGSVTVLVDFAHNPHGMAALVEVALSLPARRRLLILGQAGDRDDRTMQEFARAAWGFLPDRIILKEMEKYRRGRPIGETASVMRQEFLRLGASPATITEADSEFAAVIAALDWAQPGDLLLLPVHSERDQVLALLEKKKAEGWTPRSR
jgi:UDP-N-acetylmuramyl tripeptide synthase